MNILFSILFFGNVSPRGISQIGVLINNIALKYTKIQLTVTGFLKVIKAIKYKISYPFCINC